MSGTFQKWETVTLSTTENPRICHVLHVWLAAGIMSAINFHKIHLHSVLDFLYFQYLFRCISELIRVWHARMREWILDLMVQPKFPPCTDVVLLHREAEISSWWIRTSGKPVFCIFLYLTSIASRLCWYASLHFSVQSLIIDYEAVPLSRFNLSTCCRRL